MDWLAIDPTLTSSGAFAALATFPQSTELKPVPLPPNYNQSGTLWNREVIYDFNVAVQLGLAGVASAATSLNGKTIAYDCFLYYEVLPEGGADPIGGLIYGTRWGSGIRTQIDVTSHQGNFDLTLGNVAAAASIGMVSASFSIQGLGFSDRSILGILPGPGRFDSQSYKQILAAIAKVRSEVLSKKKSLTPVPFMILVQDPKVSFASPITKARSYLYAIRRIKEGESEVDALIKVPSDLDPVTVKKVFRTWAQTNDAFPIPSEKAQRSAKVWLSSAGL